VLFWLQAITPNDASVGCEQINEAIISTASIPQQTFTCEVIAYQIVGAGKTKLFCCVDCDETAARQ